VLGAPLSTFVSALPGARLGFRVAEVPTSSHSGVALTAPNNSEVWPDGGAVYVFDSPIDAAEFLPDEASLIITASGPSRYLGQDITTCTSGGSPRLFVGAPGNIGGAVHIFNLPATGTRPDSSAALTVTDATEGDNMGGAVACRDDETWFAAGASYASPTETRAGTVFLFSSGLSGTFMDDVASGRIDGDELGQSLGTSVSMGDINGDGVTDLLVGGGGEGASEPDASVAGLFLGPITGVLSIADADTRWDSLAPDDHLGNQVATGGDMNGDGRDDIALSAYWESTDFDRAGAVYVLLGAATGGEGLTGAAAILRGTHEYAYAGIGIDWLSDADGDGNADLAVGEYGRGAGGSVDADSVGAAHLFLGPITGTRATSEAELTLEGEESYAAFGYAVAGITDANGDGLSDLLVGAYQTGADEGSAYLFSGGVP